MKILLIIAISAASGIAGGMGMGGGTLLIPLLTLVGFSQHSAQGINLAVFIPMSAIAIIIHAKNKLIDFKTAAIIAVPAVISGVLGAFLADKTGGNSLKLMFGAFLAALGVWQLISAFRNQYPKNIDNIKKIYGKNKKSTLHKTAKSGNIIASKANVKEDLILLKTFPHGVHPSSCKEQTQWCNIEIMPTPKQVCIPLLQHAGKPAVPVVKAGDTVVKGQLIGKAERGANVYSSCCGSVEGIVRRRLSSGYVDCVLITNNGENETAHLPRMENPTPEQIIERVKECGVVGMGGAGFPTASKLSPGVQIDTLIINAAECEPYITCDFRIMIEYTDKFLTGVELMRKALGASNVIIGVENNKMEAVNVLNDSIANSNLGFTVDVLKAKYPQGSDKQLIYAVTGKKIPKGTRSSSFGLAVTNVHTAYAVYNAVKEGKQSYDRVLTVTGGGISEPKNIIVPTGASFKDVVEFCGGINEKNPPVKVINGGPMMGNTVFYDEAVVTKTTGCILLLTADEAFTGESTQCINCAKCASVCPMNLLPMQFDALARKGMYEETERLGINYCIECGSCAFVCPAKRHIVQSIRLAKNKLKEKGKK